MIYFPKLGRLGRLGNQIMQISTMFGFSKEYNCDLSLPQWKYSKYFKNFYIPQEDQIICDRIINEKNFHYTPTFWELFTIDFRTKNIGIEGWLQSWKYFWKYKSQILELFEFDEEFRRQVGERFSHILNNGKETIALSIRVGNDYKENGNYEILPINYQIGALFEYFPRWRENYNVIVFADDMEYAKLNLDCSDNIYFGDGSDIEQLCLMSMCDHFIIPNSTFGFCAAMIGEKTNGKVIRSPHYFKSELSISHSIKDFYPDHWQVYDHKNKRFNLSDVEFHIPIKYDHPDREDNLCLVLKTLNENFDTHILVGEQGGEKFEQLEKSYMHFDYPNFHRTRMLNEMANQSQAPYIVNYDADNICPILQILIAVDMLRKNQAEMVYPYDGRCARVNREKWHSKLLMETDCGIFKGEIFRGTRDVDPKSVGHIIFWNRDAFVRFGMENEHFISYGPEDVERWERAQKLGINVQRVKGITYHIDHWCGPDSTGKNPFFGANYDELERIRAMDRDELQKEIDINWDWVNKYNEAYYGEMSESAITSFHHILPLIISTKKISTVLDIGCGIGEAADACYTIYKGVDFRVPKTKLLIPLDCCYREFDLRQAGKKEFPFPEKFDMAICTEVMEHIEEEYADECISLICSKADMVMFSAAIPFQGGLQHYNEQWQDYWGEKFAQRGFYPIDDFPYKQLRNNKNIDIWYRNNLVIYRKDGNLAGNKVERYIHPDLYINIIGSMTDWVKNNKQRQKIF